MKVVIAGDKYDGEDYLRLKLHEEYGRVWLYTADADGNSVERILCIDDDGRLRIAADHRVVDSNRVYITLPIRRRPCPDHGVLCGTDEDFDGTGVTHMLLPLPYSWRLKD